MRTQNYFLAVISISVMLSIFHSCEINNEKILTADGKGLEIVFNDSLFSKVISRLDGKEVELGGFLPSEYLVVDNKNVEIFHFISSRTQEIKDEIGEGNVFTIEGESGRIKKEVIVKLYNDFPSTAVYGVKYLNMGKDTFTVNKWINNFYEINSGKNNQGNEPLFWSFQSATYEERPDWVLPLRKGYERQNYQGMNASDYGGGTPVCDVWRDDAGLAVGHLETVPKLVSIPVQVTPEGDARFWIEYNVNKILKPGDSLTTFTTFVSVHQKDYFTTLVNYRKIMMKRGINFDKQIQSAYEPVWCAWGYERNFTPEQIYNTLPKVKELGFKWAVIDDGWQTAEGDWLLDPKKFPNGDSDMKAFVDKIHQYGLKAELWWSPLAVDPGTRLIKEHPEYLLLNQNGSKQDISWWDSYYMCPSYPPVQENAAKLVKKFLSDWGFDGLKIDGQHLNAAPPCYNPAHHHSRPEESVEGVPQFFKVIYDEALRINKNAVIEICPCGTAYSFFTMPYFNQSVASDPTSSYQIRTKGKTLKALMGPDHAYFGDHVELSDNKSDFASTVGVGGVVGTKFTWPPGVHLNRESGNIDLIPDKEKIWKKWIDIYNAKLLPSGSYLGELYDIGFDKPETHAIKKDNNLYYAFYASQWQGEVDLRGLDDKTYQVKDYVNDKDLGTVKGPAAKLKIGFNNYLLIECSPVN